MQYVRLFMFLRWLFKRRVLVSGLVMLESGLKMYLRHKKGATKE